MILSGVGCFGFFLYICILITNLCQYEKIHFGLGRFVVCSAE